MALTRMSAAPALQVSLRLKIEVMFLECACPGNARSPYVLLMDGQPGVECAWLHPAAPGTDTPLHPLPALGLYYSPLRTATPDGDTGLLAEAPRLLVGAAATLWAGTSQHSSNTPVMPPPTPRGAT